MTQYIRMEIIPPQEFIGEEITIVASKNKQDLALRGKIVDETKSLLKIKTAEGIKSLFKKNIQFKIVRTGEVIAGGSITKRPEDRIKGK